MQDQALMLEGELVIKFIFGDFQSLDTVNE